MAIGARVQPSGFIPPYIVPSAPKLVQNIGAILGGLFPSDTFHAAQPGTEWGTVGVAPGADVPAGSIPSLTRPNTTGTYSTPIRVGGGVVSTVNPNASGWGAAMLRSYMNALANSRSGIPQTVSGSVRFQSPAGGKPTVYPGGAPTATNDPPAVTPTGGYTPPPPIIPADFLKNLSKQVLAMSNIDYSKLSKAAQAQARAAVAAKVAELHAVQSQYLSQGRQNMRDLFALGSVNPEPGLGSFLTSNADTAAKTIGALAQAFAPAGAPSIGAAQQAAQQVGGAPVTATGINLANLASRPGLPGPIAQSIGVSQGLIPASAIESQGLTSALEAGLLPNILQGQANQEGQMQMAEAQARARGVQPSIASALNQLPSIYQSNFTTLANAARTSANQNISNMLRMATLGISAAKANAAGNKPLAGHIYGDRQGGYSWFDPNTGISTQLRPPMPNPPKSKQISPSEQRARASALAKAVDQAVHGSPPITTHDASGWHQIQTVQPMAPEDAVKTLIRNYPWADPKRIISMLQSAYGSPGPGGTGWPSVAGRGPLSGVIVGGQPNPGVPGS